MFKTITSFFKNPGILGMNARNLMYIKPYNTKKAIFFADDKIKTKRFLSTRNIPVPKLLKIFSKQSDLDKINFSNFYKSFVAKPNMGYGGEGIVVIKNNKNDKFIKINDIELEYSTLKDHISDIINGKYSLSLDNDKCIIEDRIIPHPFIDELSYKGLADIRIIVFNLIPIMAMLRLPTKLSDGKANLHQGAIGVGIELIKGALTHITYGNKIIHKIPDVGKVRGLKIPFWDDILYITSKIQYVTNVGYLAVDISLDKKLGPVLLEMNARAGLGVQNANLAPLKSRLDKVKNLNVKSIEKGVELGKQLFGDYGKIIKKKQIDKKYNIIGIKEPIILYLKNHTKTVIGRVSLVQEKNFIDKSIFDSIKKEGDTKITLKINLSETKFKVVFYPKDFSKQDYKILLSKRILQDFLIDPNKNLKKEVKSKTKIDSYEKNKSTYIEQSKRLSHINKFSTSITQFIKPINFKEEQNKFLEKKGNYNPKFQYKNINITKLNNLEKELKFMEIDKKYPIGKLLQELKLFLSKKIKFLSLIGSDSSEFTNFSIDLYGNTSVDLVNECKNKLYNYKFQNYYFEKIDSKKLEEKIRKVLKIYRLDKIISIDYKDNLNISVIKNKIFLVNNRKYFNIIKLFKIIYHEIGTHILRSYNGSKQIYDIFENGTAYYLSTEEGLAMYNFNKMINYENKSAHLKYLITDIGLNGKFLDIVDFLLKIGYSLNSSFIMATRIKNGFLNTKLKGAFTKNILYLKGLKSIENFIDNDGNIYDLYIGKIKIEDLDLIKQMNDILPPAKLPIYIDINEI